MGLIEAITVAFISIGVLEDIAIPVAGAAWEAIQEDTNAD